MDEYESFYDDLKVVNGCLRVTVPAKLASFSGLQEGDILKIMIKKVEKQQDANLS